MEKFKHVLYEAPTMTIVEANAESTILSVSCDAPQYEGPEDF